MQECTTVVLFLLRTEGTSNRTSNLIRLLVRSVRSKNSTTAVHLMINQIAAGSNPPGGCIGSERDSACPKRLYPKTVVWFWTLTQVTKWSVGRKPMTGASRWVVHIRLLVRSVRSKNSTTIVHFIINQPKIAQRLCISSVKTGGREFLYTARRTRVLSILATTAPRMSTTGTNALCSSPRMAGLGGYCWTHPAVRVRNRTIAAYYHSTARFVGWLDAPEIWVSPAQKLDQPDTWTVSKLVALGPGSSRRRRTGRSCPPSACSASSSSAT